MAMNYLSRILILGSKFLILVAYSLCCLACSSNSNPQFTIADIEGTYYTEYDNSVYGFLVIENGIVYNDHGLYHDLYRKSVVREPYQPDRSKYSIHGNIFEIIDKSNSYEVEKVGLFGTRVVSKNPEYRIVKTKQGLRLENIDIDLTYFRFDIEDNKSE